LGSATSHTPVIFVVVIVGLRRRFVAAGVGVVGVVVVSVVVVSVVSAVVVSVVGGAVGGCFAVTRGRRP
jgi:hypothetical protein